MRYPWSLDFWQSGEWQACNEHLKDMEKAGVRYNPRRSELFRALSGLSCSNVRVAIFGQDPYPYHLHATGRAFEIPDEFGDRYPPTLRELFAEYARDTGNPLPSTGNLSRWVEQGVFLWNVVPVCRDGVSLSCEWPEWEHLNREIISRLCERGIVFAFLGGVPRRYAPLVSGTNNRVIETSHPSPRGSMNSRVPFKGSRLFTTINRHLNDLGLDPIDWRLEHASRKDARKESSNLLENITGATLPGLRVQPKPEYASSTFEV